MKLANAAATANDDDDNVVHGNSSKSKSSTDWYAGEKNVRAFVCVCVWEVTPSVWVWLMEIALHSQHIAYCVSVSYS